MQEGSPIYPLMRDGVTNACVEWSVGLREGRLRATEPQGLDTRVSKNLSERVRQDEVTMVIF